MRAITHFAIAIMLVTLAISAFWSHRAVAGEEAAQFAPISRRVLLPPATQIEVLIRNGIASSVVAGDRVAAFVSTPVVSNGRLVIPSGARLDGNLEMVSVFRNEARATISFTVLTTGNRSFAIQTRPVIALIPAKSDTEILSFALKTLIDTGLRIAIGAASGDQRLIERELIASASASGSAKPTTPIRVILTDDVEILR